MKKLIILSAFVFLTACQSTPTAPVVARADHSFETTGLGKSKLDAQKDALLAAKKQCRFKTPIVIKDSTHYNGVLGEKTDRLLNKGANVLGAMMGNSLPELSRDDDYEYTIKFKCQ